LITWNELPIAIAPEDEEVSIWSGSVVIDWKNVTGFQKDPGMHPMIAIYTWEKRGWQEQHMAYSVDRGNASLIYTIIFQKDKSF
jgi:fructan beta-fructosidase